MSSSKEKNMRKSTIDDGITPIWTFPVPMMHEDWHVTEKEGLSYAGYLHVGPDYWDDSMVFCLQKDEGTVEAWIEE